jgi:formylglycine-generating enzyme
MIVPAERRVPADAPRPAEKADPGRADIVPRTMPQRVLPPGFKAKDEAGYHESGWPRIIVGDRDGGPMVLVPGGTFMMGNDKGEAVEAPAHTVRLSTFYIDQYEVTNRQFRIFLDEAHYRGLPPGKWITDEKLRDAPVGTPAVYVNWRDAETFAIWAGKRLPTEAQWEMAARSSDGRRYPWGDQPVKWSHPRGYRQVDPVMSFQEDVSAFGVFDMAGNVMEWTRDWYEPSYFAKFRDKVVENPTGPSMKRQNSIQRVVKGGSKSWTVSARQGVDLDKRLPYLGFRCSLAVEGPEASAGIVPHPAKPEAPPGAPPPGAGPPGATVPF